MTREEAIERLKQNKAAAEFHAGMVQNTNTIENELKDIEALDMAIEALKGRPKGDWIKYESPMDYDDGKDAWDCSLCGAMVGKRMNFCPNCGADMRGDNNG